MQETIIRKTFLAEESRHYYTLPFDVPSNTQRIEVAYSYARHVTLPTEFGTRKEELNIVDLGLLDPQGMLRGWSGSQRLAAFISGDEATPGYSPGPIEAGTWQVTLGVYKVRTRVTVEVFVRLYPKARIWLCGDLHLHTLNSDGSYPTKQVIEYGKQAGLDFLALTDHNNQEQNREIGNPDGISVIPGMEYTNYMGHANFFFPAVYPVLAANPLSNTFSEMREVFFRAKEMGAAISLNHILDDDCPWLFGFEDFPYDLVEVWNGFMKTSDLKAIAWWHEQLCKGRKLAAVGGSDTHRIGPGRSHGTPTTFVQALSKTPRDILAALKEGRSFITATPVSVQLDLHLGSRGLGEEAQFFNGLKGRASLREAKRGDVLLLINAGGTAEKWKAEEDGDLEFPFTVEQTRFYRLELYRNILGIELLTALTNPVYLC